MKIVIDARMLYWTGVGRYTKELLKNLETIDHTNNYRVLVRQDDWGLWEPRSPNFQRVLCNINPYTIGEQLQLTRQLQNLKPDLVHFTTPNAPMLYRGPHITTIHDLTLLDHDTSRGTGLKRAIHRLKRLPFWLDVTQIIRSSQHLITPSRAVKDQLIKRFHVVPGKVTAIYEAAGPELAPPQTIPDPPAGPYLMYLGNYFPYKNVHRLIRAFATLAPEHPDTSLILAGKEDVYTTHLRQLISEHKLDRRVRFTGFIPDSQLAWLYAHTTGFVYPSLSEGFGLPILEAMQASAPVAISDIPVLREVAAEAAWYFDPLNPSDMARVMERLLTDAPGRQQLIQEGHARATQFSWVKMAQETLNVYQATNNDR